MTRDQKARLESAGWRVRDADAFLNVNAEENEFIETKLTGGGRAAAAGLLKQAFRTKR